MTHDDRGRPDDGHFGRSGYDGGGWDGEREYVPSYIELDPGPQGRSSYGGRGRYGGSQYRAPPVYTYPPSPPGPRNSFLAAVSIAVICAVALPVVAGIVVISMNDGGANGTGPGGDPYYGPDDGYYFDPYDYDDYDGCEGAYIDYVQLDASLYVDAALTRATLELEHRGGDEIAWSDYVVTLNGTRVYPSTNSMSVGEVTTFTLIFTGADDLLVNEHYTIRIINVETDTIDWEDMVTCKQATS